MSDIDEIVESIQRRLQTDGVSATLSEVEGVLSDVSELQDMARSLEADGNFDGIIPVQNSVRAATYELDEIRRMVGEPEAILDEAIAKIRNA